MNPVTNISPGIADLPLNQSAIPEATFSNQGPPNPGDDSHQISPVWTRVFLLVIVGILVFLNSFGGRYLFDDEKWLEDDRIRQVWPLKYSFRNPRAIFYFSMALNYAASGYQPWSYHAVNILIHLLAAVTLFGIVYRTLNNLRGSPVSQPASCWLAFLIAVTWMIHPLQTQSVTYIVQRAESLAGFFVLFSLYAYIRGVDSQKTPESAKSSRLWFLASVASCLFGFHTKSITIGLPIIILLYDWVFLDGPLKQRLAKRLPVYLGILLVWIPTLVRDIGRGLYTDPSRSTGFGNKGPSALEYALTQPGVIGYFLRLSFWPHPLCLDYWDWPIVRSAWEILPHALFLIVLFAGTLVALWKRSWLGFVGAWFFLILAPTSSFMPLRDLAFEHRMYLPLASVVTILVVGGYFALKLLVKNFPNSEVRIYRWVRIGVVCVIATLSLRTIARNNDYSDPYRFWKTELEYRPNNLRAYINFGNACIDVGEYKNAEKHYRHVLAAKKLEDERQQKKAHYNLGLALLYQHRFDEATQVLQKRLEIELDASTSATLCFLCWLDNDLEKSAYYIQKAIQENDEKAFYHCSYAYILNELGQATKANQEKQNCLALDSQWPKKALDQAWNNLEHPEPKKRFIPIAHFLALQADYATNGQNTRAANILERIRSHKKNTFSKAGVK